MIIVMQENSPKQDALNVVEHVRQLGLQPVLLEGTERNVIAVIGDERILDVPVLNAMTSVEKVMPVLAPFKLASREHAKTKTVITVAPNVSIGGTRLAIMAGNCAVETLDVSLRTAQAVQHAGATIQRGGAFKPRTSPYSFQGLGEEGLFILREVKKQTGLPIITEVLDPRQIELVAEHADILQVGTRNMQNFELLRELGNCGKPVLLKRGMAATLDEFLMSAEYILSSGNPNLILCERGIRTYETATRNTLDISAIPVLKVKTHLPVIVDPSHAAGKRAYVAALAKAAIAAGADGLLLDVHPDPARSLVDADQALSFEQFDDLMTDITLIAQAVDRTI
ncbi:MAG: 3-deoxy-7-phosphoheptulonate synthase [Candidatus Kerfeldbacteria bacterium]|nr:3-deoxy-7-phosphoheptulonate synthase [Candidatus Kerfeldbacteria bacterium]